MKIRIDNIEFSYNGTPVLKDVTASIEPGELVALVGPNGSGKSTLIKCINNILSPQGGSVLLNDTSVSSLSPVDRAKQLAYVPQNAHKIPGIKVFDVILTGRKPFISWKPSKKDVEIGAAILKKLNMEDIGMRDWDKLSGGQQQTVSIARALAQQPKVLLLDEPISNLDMKHQIEVMDLLKELSNNGISVLIALHDINMALRYADKFMMLRDGAVFAHGGREIITKKNIEHLYDVKVHIAREDEHVFIIPNGLQ